jgi:hypothetical protein
MGAPPFDEGAIQLTVACPVPARAVTPDGAAGVPAGVAGFDTAEAVLVPFAFVAATVNVYAVPLDSPVTVAPRALPLTVTVRPPGDAVTV